MNSQSTITYSYFETTLGGALVGLKGRSLVFLHFGSSPGSLLSKLKATFPHSTFRADSSSTPLSEKFRDVLDGRNDLSNLVNWPLGLVGTPFQISVWRFLQTIPPGTTVSYSDVARGIGSPKAVRAAASACAKNEIAVVIPCHRVIPLNGRIGRYRWGSWRKRALLKLEAAMKEPVRSAIRS